MHAIRRKAAVYSSDRAFTLLEAMIAAAILGIMASIAVPDLVRARIRGNESSAILSLRSVLVAQSVFLSDDPDGDATPDYAESLAELAAPGVELIDDELGGGAKSGYCFLLVSYSDETWHAHANPAEPGVTGRRYFYVDQTGVIRFSATGRATAESPALEDPEAAPGVWDERKTERAALRCGPRHAADLETLLPQYEEQALFQLGKLLPKNVSTGDALDLRKRKGFPAAVGVHLDTNNDKALDFDEILYADILQAARGVKADLFPNDPLDKPLGDDKRIQDCVEWYQKKLEKALDLGVANEKILPQIPLPAEGN